MAPYTQCLVQDCKYTIFNKPAGVSFFSCPTTSEDRNKWLIALRNKCTKLDWNKSKICSRHFQQKDFDSNRKLKPDAIPSHFPPVVIPKSFLKRTYSPTPSYGSPKTKVNRLLNQMSHKELQNDITNTLNNLTEPSDLDGYLDNNLNCKPNAPEETQLWLIIKKQDILNSKLKELLSRHVKRIEVLEKTLETNKNEHKTEQKNLDSYKYIVKCLQEKNATLEEQVEILSAVESR